jgi:hypothetical protein
MCQIVKLLINKLCLTFNPYNKLFKNRLTNTKHCNKQNISTKTIEINCLKQINNKGFSMLSFIYILPILKFIYYYSSWKKTRFSSTDVLEGSMHQPLVEPSIVSIIGWTVQWLLHLVSHKDMVEPANVSIIGWTVQWLLHLVTHKEPNISNQAIIAQSKQFFYNNKIYLSNFLHSVIDLNVIEICSGSLYMICIKSK